MRKPKLPDGWIVTGWQARLYPSREQASRCHQWAGSQRFLWNRLLDAVIAEYRQSGHFLSHKELQRLALAAKRDADLAWLADLPAHAVLDTAARLDGALHRMVAERRAGRRCGFPKYKKRHVNEAGIYCTGQRTTLSARHVELPKLGRIRLRGGDLPGAEHRVTSARLWRDGERWMLSAQIGMPAPAPMPPSGITLGVDLGVSTLVTTFDGTGFDEVAASRPLRLGLRRLRRAQRRLSRRRKGSARRRAQARRVAGIHCRVRNKRHDLLHQISHRLTAKADVIKVETLNVAGMIRNRHLALSLADAAMSRLVGFIAYKAARRGRAVKRIDRWFAGSQTCCLCGARNPQMRDLKVKVLACACGNRLGRDRNAAVNHYDYGGEPLSRFSPDRYPKELWETGACAGAYVRGEMTAGSRASGCESHLAEAQMLTFTTTKVSNSGGTTAT